MVRRGLRHGRILDIRLKIRKGWTIPQLEDFCQKHLKISKPTMKSYIDEAAEPFRQKYWREQYGKA